jgi:hypothetical protein
MKADIIALIRADIQQTSFIDYLNKGRLSADEHLLNLPEIIFSLMEIQSTNVPEFDAIQTGYMKRVRESCAFVNDNERLIESAKSIYTFLSELQKQ